jgi:hypothetical protein
VSTFVIVEMAEDGNEGLVYGLLTTTHNLSFPLARAIGNQLFAMFSPSLSDSTNYIEDSAPFRSTVAKSFVLSYFFAFSSLAFLFLMPTQKAHAQRRKKTWPSHRYYGYTTIALLTAAFGYR